QACSVACQANGKVADLDRLQSGQKFPEVGGRDHLGSRRRLSQNSLTSAVAAAAVAVASPARTGCLRLVHSGTPSPASRTIAAQDTPLAEFCPRCPARRLVGWKGD